MKTIVANQRTVNGKGAARRLRKAGLIPGVVYGPNKPTRLLQLSALELSSTLRKHGSSQPYRLQIDDQEVTVMVAEVQQRPLGVQIEHIDFRQIDMDEPVETSVAVVLEGKPENGNPIQHLHEVTVRCLPGDIPQQFTAKLDGLQAGDNIDVSKLEKIAGVEILTPEDTVIATIEAKKSEAAEEPTAEGEESASAEA